MKKADYDINGGLATALEMFKTDCARYPTTEEGLKSLISRPENIPSEKWRGPYFDPPQVPEDPWGREYCYQFPAIHSTKAYDLYSLGPDGTSKSGGNDADDIGNWEKPPHRDLKREQFIVATILLLFLAIPFLYLVRVVAGVIFPRFGFIAGQNRWANRIWLAMAVIIFVLVLIAMLMPKLAGRVE